MKETMKTVMKVNNLLIVMRMTLQTVTVAVKWMAVMTICINLADDDEDDFALSHITKHLAHLPFTGTPGIQKVIADKGDPLAYFDFL